MASWSVCWCLSALPGSERPLGGAEFHLVEPIDAEPAACALPRRVWLKERGTLERALVRQPRGQARKLLLLGLRGRAHDARSAAKGEVLQSAFLRAYLVRDEALEVLQRVFLAAIRDEVGQRRDASEHVGYVWEGGSFQDLRERLTFRPVELEDPEVGRVARGHPVGS